MEYVPFTFLFPSQQAENSLDRRQYRHFTVFARHVDRRVSRLLSYRSSGGGVAVGKSKWVSLTFSLPEYYGERIKQVAGVREVVPSLWFGVFTLTIVRNIFPRFATDPENTNVS